MIFFTITGIIVWVLALCCGAILLYAHFFKTPNDDCMTEEQYKSKAKDIKGQLGS